MYRRGREAAIGVPRPLTAGTAGPGALRAGRQTAEDRSGSYADAVVGSHAAHRTLNRPDRAGHGEVPDLVDQPTTRPTATDPGETISSEVLTSRSSRATATSAAVRACVTSPGVTAAAAR